MSEDTAVLIWLCVSLALQLGLTVVCFMKGKWVFAILTLFGFTLFGIIGAIRLAKPDSTWARRYTDTKMAEAKKRFPKQAARVDPGWTPAPDPLDEPEPVHPQDSVPYEWEDPSDLDRISRRAFGRSGGD